MPDLSGGWRHPGWSWTVRHPRAVTGGYWVATLLLGAVLGTFLPMTGGAWNAVLLWVCLGLTVVAVLAFACSEVARRNRDRMLRENGTAYVIYEDDRGWTPQDVTRFLDGVTRQFARVVRLPGPRKLARGWDWSLRPEAARQWDSRTDELVRAFRVISQDEKTGAPATPDGVFVWAWWAVAVAFGMRVTAADRGLSLDVWQRPSRSREAAVYPEVWAQRPHRFAGPAPAAPAAVPYKVSERVWQADLSVTRWGQGRLGADSARVAVLLVRFSSSQWGPVPPVDVPVPEDERLDLKLYDSTGVVRTGPVPVEIHELRCVPPEGGFAWDAFPALAARAVTWIKETAGKIESELERPTLLLGTLMPQEVGLMIGLQARQDERHGSWPAHLWPVLAESANYDLVVPNLDLGSVPLSAGSVG